MFAPTGRLGAAEDRSTDPSGIALATPGIAAIPAVAFGRAGIAWWRLIAAALASLALAWALYGELGGERSPIRSGAIPATSRQVSLSGLPSAARGPISGALGAASAAYRSRVFGAGFETTSPAQHLRAQFQSSAVRLRSGALAESLSLRAVGYRTSLMQVGAARPSARANRVSYARRGLSEWYVNGPLGLEQGFTLARAPAAAAVGPLTLVMALSGNAHAVLGPAGQSITLSRPHGPSLRYGGLLATDARGHRLHTWLALGAGRLYLRVDTAGARYPLRIDPFVQQGSELTGGEESGEGRFGRSVVLSADGNTALIAGPRNSGESGAVWVFTREGSSWTQQARLEGEGEEGKDFFGRGLALSADGKVALVGDPGADEFVGAASIFTREGSTWTQRAKLLGGGEFGAGYFGRSVALSPQGNVALIGGFEDHGRVGAAWVFAGSGSSWTQQGELTGGEEEGDAQFGYSVALASEGDTALITGNYDHAHVGAAWVFTRQGSTWAQQGKKLTPAEEVGKASFGTAAALSFDGDTALIGGAQDDDNAGAAWVFQREGSSWTQQGPKLTGAEASVPAWFGHSVALSSSGNTALVGGYADDDNVGAAWVFTREGATWAPQTPKLTAGEEGPEGEFGYGVALSANAGTALIGGLAVGENVGAAWVFENSSPESEPPGEPEPPKIEPPPAITPIVPTTTTSTTTALPALLTSALTTPPTPPAVSPPAPPVLATTGNLALVTGSVLVRLPGSSGFVRLAGPEDVPFGTLIDARHGTVSITVAGPHGGTQTGHFFEGEFLLSQSSNGMVTATLAGGNFAVCPGAHHSKGPRASRASVASSSRHRVVRKLWADAHGSFSTKGNYAAGAVQGTRWLTEDRCDGTWIHVTRDRVLVTDFVRHRRIVVLAGHDYLAKAP